MNLSVPGSGRLPGIKSLLHGSDLWYSFADFILFLESYGSEGDSVAEKRSPVRHKKRLSVRFGADRATRIEFSEDLSLGGMFIRCQNAYPPNTRILVEFMLENEHRVMLEARVMWGKMVPQNLFHPAKKCGMGARILRFLSGGEYYRLHCERMANPNRS
jgi:hypothetical protein